MKKLNYNVINDLNNTGLFDSLPDMTQECFELLCGDLMSRIDFDQAVEMLDHLNLDYGGNYLEADNERPTVDILQEMLKATFDHLWDLIKDCPAGRGEIIKNGCWLIIYLYNDTFDLSIHFCPTKTGYYSNGALSYNY